VFGSLLAIEATVTFFLESTFVAVWAFGWNRLSRRVHAVAIWLVALAANMSAVWILIANAWMQSPVGYTIRNGRAELTDFLAVVTQRFAILQIIHTLAGAYVLAAFFVMGVSAYQILRRHHVPAFSRSFKLAAGFALIFSILVVAEGHLHGAELGRSQPAKLAAMEAHWQTRTHAPIYVVQLPDPENERNRFQFGAIRSALSLLAYHNSAAEVKGLKGFPPDERPPVTLTFISFRLMVGIGFLLILLSIAAFAKRNHLQQSPKLLKLMMWVIPLPYIANQLGWTVAEVGRQPWIVYDVLKTTDAVSPVSAGQVGISLAAFVVVYSLLGLAAFYLMARFARQGIEASQAL